MIVGFWHDHADRGLPFAAGQASRFRFLEADIEFAILSDDSFEIILRKRREITLTESIVSAVGGWLVACILAVTAFLERRSNQRHNVHIQALEYLTGGSQRRSVGIALIEGLWAKNFPYLESLLPALVNQAVYLLLETESREGRHQFHSWLRIMRLILRAPYTPELFEEYTEISHALFQHIEADGQLCRGIVMTIPTAEIWFEKINAHASI